MNSDPRESETEKKGGQVKNRMDTLSTFTGLYSEKKEREHGVAV
jgi:hypothetical protein